MRKKLRRQMRKNLEGRKYEIKLQLLLQRRKKSDKNPQRVKKKNLIQMKE